jgi:hypothetical protein
MEYCRAVWQLGIGCSLVAHVTKADNGDQRPFGSTFWHNSARATWNLKLASTSPDGNMLHLAAFHRKSNLGRLRPPVGIRVDFDGDRVYFTRIDATTIDEVADNCRFGSAFAASSGADPTPSLPSRASCSTTTSSRSIASCASTKTSLRKSLAVTALRGSHL